MDNNLRYTIWDHKTVGKTCTTGVENVKTMMKLYQVRQFLQGLLRLTRMSLTDHRIMGWCLGNGACTEEGTQAKKIGGWVIDQNYKCSSWGDINSVKPGSFGVKLGTFFSKLLVERKLS